ncbi:tripartite tricarboxylate transporter TctB family protein [Vibrio sp. TH_r3]|uniref:tripartite tricarboxylate transporter TctB family protein n=1 Tax=Vibrio sp. TH_r3 TaxID=3082084 RepID=UPI002954F84F|nr:tripartite tricarboxylate transporter TctB family protein [Vibrio sp. TH_r3]MDV7105873.1 tripartite tricarboxylate transporter TctB family protein [Vibrio sp. TH_r3]
MKITTNIIGSALFIGLSLFILYAIPEQILASSNVGINAQSFPRWITILMLVSSIFLFINEVRLQIKQQTEEKAFKIELNTEMRSLLFIVLIVAYALATPKIGFLFSSIAFSILSLIFFRITNMKYTLFLVACCLLVNYVFKNLLLVQLP